MSDIVKSIFRRREIEKIYEIGGYHGRIEFLRNWSINIRMDVKKNMDNIISDKEIAKYDIAIPMLEVGEEFFLHDIQEVVIIKNRMRSSDGSITYYVEDKLVDTENTKRTKEECSKIVREFENLRKCFEEYANKYKYEHKYFNSKGSHETMYYI